MFLRFRQDVKSFLKPGQNRIEIVVTSIRQAIETEKQKQTLNLLANCGPDMKLPGLNLLRKTICHGGWDWGISLPVSGIYGKIMLCEVDTALIKHACTTQYHIQDGCRLRIETELNAVRTGKYPVTFSFNEERRTVEHDLTLGKNSIAVEFFINKPKLWYPAGYGEHPLYPLVINTPEETVRKNIGLRQSELINQKDEVGTSMTFRINGVDIFCKGADWIPCDAFPKRHTREVYERLISDAAAANMNMLRVWGGGQYEHGDFYELCDEKGIMVWQDCMFACQLYPSSPDFLALVRAELDYQIHRLRDHACIVLWCGDNECTCYFAWDPKDKISYLLNYDRLNQAVEAAVTAADPTRPFWPSSPCNGPMGYVGSWHDDSQGDMHYWDVWHGGKSFEAYYDVLPRFCSEFGYQAFPAQDTVDFYTAGLERNITSPVMEHHQKNTSGNLEILKMFSRYFRIPDGFNNFIYLSQVQQAQAIRMAVEYWRTKKPVCMGTLYWQFNDNWPVASWSSIDYFGHWKQLHYHARRFYAPLIAGCFRNKDKRVEIRVSSDVNASCFGTLRLRTFDWRGRELRRFEFPLDIPPLAAQKIAEFDEFEMIDAPNAGFAYLELEASDGSCQYSHKGEFFFTEYKRCELMPPEIHAEPVMCNDKKLVKLSCKYPAFFVFAELRGIRAVFSDNSFTLLPDQPQLLEINAAPGFADAEVFDRMVIHDLRSSYAD